MYSFCDSLLYIYSCIRNCGELVNGRSRLRVQALCLSDICTDTEVPAFSWTFYILNELSGQFELAEVPTEEITGKSESLSICKICAIHLKVFCVARTSWNVRSTVLLESVSLAYQDTPLAAC